MSKQTALAFVDAINAHDVEKILSLMTEDHLFIDTYGDRQTKVQMETGWPGYFEWFPDYHIEVAEVLQTDNTVALFGYASGTYKGVPAPDRKNYWRLPAAWRVVAQSGKVKVWQVFADSKIPYDCMKTE